jgi:PKD repeat protein
VDELQKFCNLSLIHFVAVRIAKTKSLKMKKVYLFLAQALLLTGVVFAQNTAQSQHKHDHVKPCRANDYMDELMKDPAIKLDMEQSAQELEQFANQFNGQFETRGGTQYVIPVVFHILHMNGSENISDEQVYDAMARMNEDFNKLNNNWTTVKEEFLGIVADVGVELRLAKRKPNGECFKGITRTVTMTTFNDSGNDQVSAVQAAHGNFPGNQYLNIFVVADAGGAAGYTTYPANWSATFMGNGIKILHNYVGRIGTSSPGVSTALSHEVGHWLNLPHTWGNSNEPGLASNCTSDDGVADTPNTIGWTTCNRNGESCGSLDNVENFMEYSYCSKMFTEGQGTRMRNALNSSTGGRNNLWTTTNLTNTGVFNDEVFCKADFYAPITEVCIGSAINFVDDSFFNPTEWNWTFQGGTPATSNEQNPTVVYNTPGVYNVVLTSGDGVSSNTMTRNGYIRVLPTTTFLPFLEGFENHTTIAGTNGLWTVNNPGNNQAWEVYEGAGHTGNKSVRLNNASQPAGGIDELLSGTFDLSSLPSTEAITLTFRYSFKQRAADNSDRLRVYATANCGETWQTRRQLLSSTMSLGTQTTAWVPASQSDWVTNHVTNLTSTYYTNGMRIKFEFENGGGNNIYLDDINLYVGSNDPLSIEENTEVFSGVLLFPNPAAEELTVRLDIPQAMNFDVNVRDLSGKELQSFRIQGQEGTNDIMLNLEGLAQGMYFVEVVSGSGKVVKQFIKK